MAVHSNGKKVTEIVSTIVAAHGASHDELIPILTEINHDVGYLPDEALDEVSKLLQVSKSQVFSVATFYHMLSTKPRGKHVVKFCESAPCHVVGGREVWLKLQEELNISAEQTTSDGKWSLITTSCLGVCGVGPVLLIDDDIYGNVTPDQVPEILAHYS